MARRTWPLRLKLTLWYLLVFAGLQALLLLATLLVRRDAIGTLSDDRLQRVAERIAMRMGSDGIPLTSEALRALAPKGESLVFIAVRDLTNAIVVGSGIEAGKAPPFVPRVQPETRLIGPELHQLDADQAQRFTGSAVALRTITLPFREPQGSTRFLQVGVRMKTLAGYLSDQSDLVVVALPAGFLAAAFAAWLIAGRAVQPLGAISRAAREVSPRDPSVRINIGSRDEEITRLNDELNRALDRMEAGYRAQERFIANVAHELKTPISVLLTESQVLGDDADRGRQRAFVRSVEEEMRRLSALVEAFLRVARAQADREDLELQRVEVQDVVLGSVRRCTRVAELHGVRLVANVVGPHDCDVDVIGDPQLLGTMLDNLIRNAIRFSQRGDRVEVTCDVSADEVRIAVRDRGPGIPREYLERVFERFARAPTEPGRGRATGSGLGLAIVREIAELHGGVVEARSDPDEGCELIARFPVKQPAEVALSGSTEP